LFEEIQKLIEKIESLPKPPIKIKMNEKWIQSQIDKGVIIKESYKRNGDNFFTGIPVEIADEVEIYEFVYIE
jgi:hypothetical protein